MHMLMMTTIGLLMLAGVMIGAKTLNRGAPPRTIDGPRIFLWIWLVVSAGNFLTGVFVAGYSVMSELGVHVIVFGVPAGLAWYLMHHAKQSKSGGSPE